MKFAVRKFDGDDSYNWAVFRKVDLPKGHRGVVFWGDVPPVICGLSRAEANYHKKRLEDKE